MRGMPGLRSPHRGMDQPQTFVTASVRSHCLSWKRGKGFSGFLLVSASEGSLVMCLWSRRNGQTHGCSRGGGAGPAAGDASAAVTWREAGGRQLGTQAVSMLLLGMLH